MGIRGLTGWIKWAAESAGEPNWTEWSGQRIGIDILGFLYKAKAQKQSPFLFVIQLIAACKKHNIIPVIIFDGKPPNEKLEALKHRSAARLATIATTDLIYTLSPNTSYLTSDERDIAKQLFYACGVLSLNATGEADSILAYFSRRGELAAIISNDLDLLARGVENLLVPESYALPGDKSGWIHYRLSVILRTVEFSYNQFLEMCVLMGSDYTVGLKSLPYKSAYCSVKYHGTMQLTLSRSCVTDIAPYNRAFVMLNGSIDTVDSLMGEKQWDKWAAGIPPAEYETLAKFREIYFPTISDEDYYTISSVTGLTQNVL